jgi:aarF domain-containing kinase
MVPDEYVEELKRLQDEVPAFSGKRAVRIIEEELKKPVSELFSEFSEKPLAAASLGQVHRAVTVDGQEVAIKVQRDKLKEMYDLDLAQFDKVAGILDKFGIGIQGAKQGWSDIFKEAKVILYREIDYTAEAQNTIRFSENFDQIPWVRVPKVIESLTNTHVLTMEYAPGIKISDLEKLDSTSGIDRSLLSQRLAQAYLLQFCEHGFFNTDPHPGNLAVDTAYPGGRLVFYDFGQACELQDSQSDGILQVIQSIVDLDAPACVQAMEKLGALKEDANKSVIQKTIENNFKTGKVKSKRSKRKRELTEEEKNFKPPSQSETMKYLQLPSQLAFVARALTQMAGVGSMLDEDYEFIDCVAEKVPELQMKRGAGLGYLAGQVWKNFTREAA